MVGLKTVRIKRRGERRKENTWKRKEVLMFGYNAVTPPGV